jgi:hypothetical protein
VFGGKVLSNSELLGQSCFTYGMGPGELKDPWKIVLYCTRFVLPRGVYSSYDQSSRAKLNQRPDIKDFVNVKKQKDDSHDAQRVCY